MTEALRMVAWLEANAKYMKYPNEIAEMRRAARIMRELNDELQKQKAVRDGKRKSLPTLWRQGWDGGGSPLQSATGWKGPLDQGP